MASKEYFEDKSKLYYENFINHKCTQKVRGIILNADGQILLLHSKKHNGYSIPGGTVEAGETIKDTVIREVMEETGADIVPLKVVGKYYHTSKNFSYDGIKFDSERVEFFYYCKFNSFVNNNLGIKGEFDAGDVRIEFLDYDDFVKARLMKRDKSMVERAINEFLLYKADDFNEKININMQYLKKLEMKKNSKTRLKYVKNATETSNDTNKIATTTPGISNKGNTITPNTSNKNTNSASGVASKNSNVSNKNSKNNFTNTQNNKNDFANKPNKNFNQNNNFNANQNKNNNQNNNCNKTKFNNTNKNNKAN